MTIARMLPEAKRHHVEELSKQVIPPTTAADAVSRMESALSQMDCFEHWHRRMILKIEMAVCLEYLRCAANPNPTSPA